MAETINLAITGEKGEPGKSAYQLWLDAGNTGDVAAFLTSQKGAQGDPGKSAYQIWLDLGNVGTPDDFIASLKGPKGDAGTGGGGGGYAQMVLFYHPAGYNLLNIPTAETEFPYSRMSIDLTGRTQARLSATLQLGGTSSSELKVQYSADGGSTWSALDGTDAPKLSIGTAGFKLSAWANIAAAAKADVLLRLVTVGGDGAADPNFRRISLELK